MGHQSLSVEVGRCNKQTVTLAAKDRRTHLHVIGPSQSGKTRLLEHMVKQDIRAGHGVCVLDPTGNLFKRLAMWCAARDMHKRRRIHFLDPNSDELVPVFNPLQRRPHEDVSKRVDAMVMACARVWSEDPNNTPLLKRCLRAVFTVLIEHDLTLVEAVDLILPPSGNDEDRIRNLLTKTLANPYAKRVWARFDAMRDDKFDEVFSSTNNRMADFLMSERMRRIFGFGNGSLNLERCMNERHALIVNLQPLHISADNARLLGTLITSELLQVARSRDNQLAEAAPFFCYLDEAYRFLSEDIEQAIDETRQKGLHYVLFHQRLSQLTEAGPGIYGGVMSIRNKIVFGDLDYADTNCLARELFQGQYDKNQEVEALRQPMVVDYTVRQNRQHRKIQTKTKNRATTSAENRNLISSTNTALSLPTDHLGLPLTGNFLTGGTTGQGRAHGRARGATEGRADTGGTADGWAESAWPVMEERSRAVRSYEEQMNVFAKDLRQLPERTVLLKRRGQLPMQISVPYVGDPVFNDKRLPRFFAEAADCSPFIQTTDAADIRLENRTARLKKLIRTVREREPDDYFE